MSGWSDAGSFTTLSDMVIGDANCDDFVNVLDIVTVINNILGQEPSPFCFENADANDDGSINVLDLVRIINLILGVKKSAQFDNDSDPAHIFLMPAGIDLESDGTLAGIQLDLEGIEAGAPLLNLEIPGFEIVQQPADSRLRVLIFSLDNRTIPAGRIALASFHSGIPHAGWGDVLAGNAKAEPVQVIKHLEVLDVPDMDPEFSFRVFPNPGKGQFTIELSLPQESDIEWTLSDLTGRELNRAEPFQLPSGTHHIPYQEGTFPDDGIYFLRITVRPIGGILNGTVKMSKVVIIK